MGKPQPPLNNENHAELLEQAYSRFCDSATAKQLAQTVLASDAAALNGLGTRLRKCTEAVAAAGNYETTLINSLNDAISQSFGNEGALKLPAEQAVPYFLQKTASVPDLALRLQEQKVLLEEMQGRFGKPVRNYVAAHLDKQFADAFQPDQPFETSAKKLLNDDLWKRVKICAAALEKDSPNADHPVRIQFLNLPEAKIDQVLHRLKQWQLHWETKQTLPKFEVTGRKHNEKKLIIDSGVQGIEMGD